FDTGLFQFRLHADHGAADDVGGRALDGGVDRGAFDEAAFGGVAGIGVGEVDLAAENRRDIAVDLHPSALLVHIVPDAGEALEIGLDVVARLAAGNAELVGQAKGGNAVDDAEIDRLGAAAHIGGHAFYRHTE